MIGVCMWYDNNIKEYGDKFMEINSEYCKRMGYIFFCSHISFTDKHPAYNKVPYMIDILENNRNLIKHLVWMDADSYVVNDRRIEDYIQDIDFCFSGDIQGQGFLNTGIFIVKNNDYVINFMKEWDKGKYGNVNPCWWEQGKLLKMIEENVLDILQHFIVYKYGILQDFHNKEYALMYHMAGRSHDDRVNEANTLKLDY